MILNANVPSNLAKFGDVVRYLYEGTRQVDFAHDVYPRPDGCVSIRWGERVITPENILEIIRPVEVRPGDVWVTDRGYEARILDTAAPGLNPIVALLIRGETSAPLQFSWCGISATSAGRGHRLLRPKSMENEQCSMTSTSSSEAISED